MDINMDVNKIVEKIADGLGVATERVYPVLRQQAVIEGWYSLLLTVICLGIVGIGIYCTYKLVSKFKMEDEDEGVYIILAVFISMLLMITFGVGLEFFKDAFTAFYNPDYYIIEEIIRQIK